MKITRSQLRQIIKEEIEKSISEDGIIKRAIANPGRGAAWAALGYLMDEDEDEVVKLEAQSKSITGYPGELPVDVDKTTALERYRQQMSSLETQIANASTSTEKQSLQGQLSDVTKAHDKLAQS